MAGHVLTYQGSGSTSKSDEDKLNNMNRSSFFKWKKDKAPLFCILELELYQADRETMN